MLTITTRRVVFIPQKVADRLREYVVTENILDGERIFPLGYTRAREIVKNAGKKIGIDVKPHDLQRHMDVHGAGAQRSDPKTGRLAIGHGPQGDVRRVKNFVRLVRGGEAQHTAVHLSTAAGPYPETIRVLLPPL